MHLFPSVSWFVPTVESTRQTPTDSARIAASRYTPRPILMSFRAATSSRRSRRHRRLRVIPPHTSGRHMPLAHERTADPVADRACLGDTTADVRQCDGAHQKIIGRVIHEKRIG